MTNDEAGQEEGQIIVGVAERLAADGMPVSQVTAGGTMTGCGAATVDGVTEVRAGTYVFYDAMQVGFGAATADEVAAFVLATVISTRRDGWATVDGGSKTFSGDRSGAEGSSPIAAAVDQDVAVVRITEEHGMAQLGEGVSVEVGRSCASRPSTSAPR